MQFRRHCGTTRPRGGLWSLDVRRERRHSPSAAPMDRPQIYGRSHRNGLEAEQIRTIVARHHGIAANQLFTWRRLMAQGALTAAGAGEEVVPASELRAAHHQIRELQR